jgi:hypothetical protein
MLEILILAAMVASIAWTVTHEEIFREPREYCEKRIKTCCSLPEKKFFYLFTCEYCFSHYVTALVLFITQKQLMFTDWRGYLVAFFTIVAIANVYMTLYFILRKTLVLVGEKGKHEKGINTYYYNKSNCQKSGK